MVEIHPPPAPGQAVPDPLPLDGLSCKPLREALAPVEVVGIAVHILDGLTAARSHRVLDGEPSTYPGDP